VEALDLSTTSSLAEDEASELTLNGGIAGSISQTEDIADRILSFLNVAFL